MLELTEQELEQIEQLAYAAITIEEIAIVCGLNFKNCLKEYRNPYSAFFLAYKKGEIMRKAKIQTNIMNLAAHGNTIAVKEANKLHQTAKSKNYTHGKGYGFSHHNGTLSGGDNREPARTPQREANPNPSDI